MTQKSLKPDIKKMNEFSKSILGKTISLDEIPEMRRKAAELGFNLVLQDNKDGDIEIQIESPSNNDTEKKEFHLDIEGLLRRARSFLNSGKNENALDLALQAWDLIDKNTPEMLKYAASFLIAESYTGLTTDGKQDFCDKAEFWWKEALNLFPDRPMAIASLGQVYILSGKLELGIELIDKALSMDPDQDWAIIYRARANRELDIQENYLSDYDYLIKNKSKITETIKDFSLAKEIYSGQEYLVNIGRTDLTLMKIERFKDLSNLICYVAEYLLGENEMVSSEKLIKRAMQIPHTDPMPEWMYGKYLLDKKKYKEALIYLFAKRGNYVPSGNTGVCTDIGICYFRLGDTKNAKLWFEKTLKMNPNDSLAQTYLKKI